MSKNQSRIAVKYVLAIVSVFAAVCGASLAAAQTSRWTADDVKEIRDLYDAGQRALAIDRLQQKLDANGSRYSDDVLDGILPILKDYFSEFDEPKLFQGIIEKMLRKDKDRQIVDYFKESTSLHSAAETALEKWLKPHKAEVVLTRSQVVVGDTTTCNFSVFNRAGDRVGSEGMEVRVSPPAKATVDAATRRITSKETGRVTVSVTNAEGRQFGFTVLTVVKPPRRTARVDIVVQSPDLTVGDATDFSIKVFDQNGKPLPEDGVALYFDIIPTGLATLDEAGKRVTAHTAGTVTLRVLDAKGNVQGETDIRIRGAVVKVEPIARTIKVGESTTFVVRSTRSLTDQNVSVTIKPEATATAQELLGGELERKVKVTGRAPGSATLFVKNANGDTVAEAGVEVLGAGASGPSVVPLLVSGVATAGLLVAYAATENNGLLIAGGIGVGVTAFLAYKYFSARSQSQEQAFIAPPERGFGWSVDTKRVGLTYNF